MIVFKDRRLKTSKPLANYGLKIIQMGVNPTDDRYAKTEANFLSGILIINKTRKKLKNVKNRPSLPAIR